MNDESTQLLTRWVEQFGNAILRTCFLLLGDRQQAEDAMQDTFLKAWKAMNRFEGRDGCTEKTWLMRIAINTCRDYRRSRWARHIDATQALDTLAVPAEQMQPDERWLLSDILRMPTALKQVLILYYYQQMTLDEAAQALGTSRSTVHRRLKRAEALLRDTLKGGEGL